MRYAAGLLLWVAVAGAQGGEPATHQKLIPTLWVQTSVEWRAICLQTYRAATEALGRALKDKSWTAALEQSGKYRKLPSAVVLDIDETVLDNARAQARQVLANSDFVLSEWNRWVAEQQAAAIPGAADFCRYAASRRVRVFYVTNRDAGQEEATLANLQQLGFPASRETLLCRGEKPEWGSDKTSRRQEIAAAHRILLLIGDDLADFLPGVRTSVDQRALTAEPYRDNWGRKWFLLPNPGYGSWEEALYAPQRPGDAAGRLKRKWDALRP